MTDGVARVRFEPDGAEAEVPVGTTLLDAAHIAGVGVPAPCGGVGRCGACRVTAEGALSPLTATEADVLGGAGVAAGKRLACRARAEGDVRVTLGRVKARPRIEGAPVGAAHVHGKPLGCAVDLGTTTIAVAVVDLPDGPVAGGAAALNPQERWGADVMSRVSAAIGGATADLRRAVLDRIDDLVSEAVASAGAPDSALDALVVCGNTAMCALLLGRDVTPLGAAPYAGADVSEARLTARDLGLSVAGDAEVYVPPGASAFIGPDVTAGLLATHLAERQEPTLLIDMGTNAEIVLAAEGRLRAASAAAGPALEGARIECGMRAETGAIERVDREGDTLVLGVIDDAAPVGICGSGLVDLVAALLEAGVLDASGRLRDDTPDPLAARVVERDGQRAFIVDDGAGIVLTQKDVRETQLALAAVRTAVDLLLAEAGHVDPADVVIAGGFGRHLRASSLVRLGVLPQAWESRVSFAGNTALMGARMLLAGTEACERAADLASAVETLDLATHPAFQARFVSALTFPG
ncbi:MAG: DUF4445 domain-containing protein [Aeromicrobium sp.]|nr:DUF4445 domain-containing protein [Aeromicrobium sp.]